MADGSSIFVYSNPSQIRCGFQPTKLYSELVQRLPRSKVDRQSLLFPSCTQVDLRETSFTEQQQPFLYHSGRHHQTVDETLPGVKSTIQVTKALLAEASYHPDGIDLHVTTKYKYQGNMQAVLLHIPTTEGKRQWPQV